MNPGPLHYALILAGAFAVNSPAPDVLERVFAPPCDLNTWQFAQKHLWLDEKASPTNPGFIDPDITPHTKFFQECLDDPAVFQITVKKCSQSAFTQAVLNKIAKCVAVEPTNVLYAIDSLQEIKRIARTRLKPMLERCELTRAVISEDDDNELQTLTFYLRDMTVYFAGGGSIGAVANKSIGLGIVDEADKIPAITSAHSHLVEEVKSRFKSVTAFKLVVLSCPNEETDITTTEYKKGSQHKYFVPCPHCDHFQLMVPDNVIFSHCKLKDGRYDQERVKREAYYRCSRAGTAECPDGKIYDHHKRAMSIRGQWRPTNPHAEPGHISLEASDLYSLFPGATLGLIALDIISTQKDPVKKKAVWSNRFGQEWKSQRTELKNEDIYALCGDYKRGTLPAGVGRQFVIPLGSDVQGDVRKWVRGAFNRKGELFVTNYGECLAYDDLRTEAAVPILGPDGKEYTSPEGIIDEGFETKLVRGFCLRPGIPFFPAKGRGRTQVRTLVATSPAAQDGAELDVLHFNDDEFKRGLYIDRIRDLPKIISGKLLVPRLWLPSDCEPEFIAELCGERLVPQTMPGNFIRMVWEKNSINDWGDALKILYVWWFTAASLYEEAWAAEDAAAASAKPAA